MVRQVAIAVLFLAVGLSCEENKRPDIAQNKSNEQAQSAPPPSKENNQAGTPNANGARDDSPQWYASPEWWLVILGFPTLAFIGWQAWLSKRALQEMQDAGTQASKQLELAHRPWLVPKITLKSPLTSNAEEISIDVAIQLDNIGETPAVGIWTHADLNCSGEFKYLVEQRNKLCRLIHPPSEFGWVVFPKEPVFFLNWKIAAKSSGNIGEPCPLPDIIIAVQYGASFDESAEYYTGIIFNLSRIDTTIGYESMFTRGTPVLPEALRMSVGVAGTTAK